MTAQDKFIFILTFITGFVAGAYVYVVAFKPTYAPETINTSELVAQEFSVIGKQYGGSRENDYIPPSFRIIGDGSFDYRGGGTTEDSLEPTTGYLPKVLINDIKLLATPEELEFLSEPINNSDCQNYVDGVDYQYRFILDGVEYQLDSCTTRLGYDSDLSVALDDVWSYLDDPTTTGSRPIFGDSFYDTSVNFIRDRLSPYEE